MRFAYADPPYLGQCARYEHEHGTTGLCWDDPETHADLIGRLEAYDGWALSLHVPSLRVILPLVPVSARICAWVKPWARMHPGARLQYGWEPVLVAPLRAPRDYSTRDYVSANASRGIRPRPVDGIKPDAFCFWLFQAGGLRPDDDFHDLFSGSGAVGRAWERWRRQPPLPLPSTKRAQARAMDAWPNEGS